MIISWPAGITPEAVSTIPFVGEYWCYWYALGNGKLAKQLEEIVSTYGNIGLICRRIKPC